MAFAKLILVLGLFDNCHVQHVQQQAVIVQPAQVYYFVGQQVRSQALVQHQLRSDPDYAEFLEFKKWKAAQGNTGAAVDANATGSPAAPSPVTTFCARCHSGAAPKGGFYLDGTSSVSADTITSALRQIASGEMPPDRQLSPQEKGELMQTLLDLEGDSE